MRPSGEDAHVQVNVDEKPSDQILCAPGVVDDDVSQSGEDARVQMHVATKS